MGERVDLNEADGNVVTQLPADQVHAALDWLPLMAALEAAFLAPPTAPVRHMDALSPTDALLCMPAWNATALGIKLVTVIPSAPLHGGRTVDATYLLLDRATGAPRALLDGEALTVRRTAATSALAARALARADATTLLMVGTGRLAPWMVRAHVAARPTLQRVLVWGRDGDAAGRLAELLQREGIPAAAAMRLPDAVAEADIVCCATTASAPVVHGGWLRPGTHLDLVGAFTPQMREVDAAAVVRARVVVDVLASALAEAGDLLQPLAAGAIDRAHVLGDLGLLLRGACLGRTNAQDITLFKSVGHALEDLAAAQLALHRLEVRLSTP
ncbi:MAG: ornithine cyclodeaminase family protein [Gemmatimonas sp.]|jgi:alanine dehydrogenase|uniref:ornithine cyclodeaminase family protein n=1 Tax=Gemmatimonas sp. TaxID=1962908 RepID=UPI00391FA7C0|nr:ornithine cyclodeaminase family protein [Gemmatimonadota bacterium]